MRHNYEIRSMIAAAVLEGGVELGADTDATGL